MGSAAKYFLSRFCLSLLFYKSVEPVMKESLEALLTLFQCVQKWHKSFAAGRVWPSFLLIQIRITGMRLKRKTMVKADAWQRDQNAHKGPIAVIAAPFFRRTPCISLPSPLIFNEHKIIIRCMIQKRDKAAKMKEKKRSARKIPERNRRQIALISLKTSGKTPQVIDLVASETVLVDSGPSAQVSEGGNTYVIRI